MRAFSHSSRRVSDWQRAEGEENTGMEAQQEGARAILLAIGDTTLRETLDVSLGAEGYSTLLAADGETALALAQEHPLLLVLLDFALPQRDGLEMCRMLRMQQETAYVPILMIAMHDDETETIVGLEVGADDYVTFPFQWKILRARIRALLRRSKYTQRVVHASERVDENEEHAQEDTQVLVVGDLRIDVVGRNVIYHEQPIELSARLFDLLVYLARHPNVALTRKELMEQVHIETLKAGERVLDGYVHWLREKLEDDPTRPEYIQTIRGVGYRFTG